VYTHRRLSLPSLNLPAHSVDYGADQVEETATSGLYWSLSVMVTAAYAGSDESAVRAGLLQMRTDAHRAIMASPGVGMNYRLTLGLSFVVNVWPVTAAAPEIEVAGDTLVGTLSSEYRVLYTTPVNDPDP
jgi:hypothetical protein